MSFSIHPVRQAQIMTCRSPQAGATRGRQAREDDVDARRDFHFSCRRRKTLKLAFKTMMKMRDLIEADATKA